VTGTIEITGAALLIVPRLTGGSAVLLGAVMITATLIEFFVLHRPPIAALTCLSGHTFVAWARISKRSHLADSRREYRGRRVGLLWRASVLTPPTHESRPQ
jgi:hypothetical protein